MMRTWMYVSQDWDRLSTLRNHILCMFAPTAQREITLSLPSLLSWMWTCLWQDYTYATIAHSTVMSCFLQKTWNTSLSTQYFDVFCPKKSTPATDTSWSYIWFMDLTFSDLAPSCWHDGAHWCGSASFVMKLQYKKKICSSRISGTDVRKRRSKSLSGVHIFFWIYSSQAYMRRGMAWLKSISARQRRRSARWIWPGVGDGSKFEGNGRGLELGLLGGTALAEHLAKTGWVSKRGTPAYLRPKNFCAWCGVCGARTNWSLPGGWTIGKSFNVRHRKTICKTVIDCYFDGSCGIIMQKHLAFWITLRYSENSIAWPCPKLSVSTSMEPTGICFQHMDKVDQVDQV